MKKIAKFGIVGLLLVGLVASAIAHPGLFRNEAVKEALEANDYDAWKEAISSELTEERFNKMHDRYTKMQERRAEIDAAIEEGYDAWYELVSETPRGEYLTQTITEENWETFVAMHEARQDGDFETAKALADELGLEKPHKCGKGQFRPK